MASNQDKISSQLEIQQYLSDKNVYGYLQQLLKDLMITQPTNTIDYLISKLEEPEQKRIFIVGPPGLKVQELALSIADSQGDNEKSKFNTFSIGDQITKELNKKVGLAGSIEEAFNNFEYVSDAAVNEIMGVQLEKYKQEKKSYIVEGFPKTRVQALFLHKHNIHPTALIILNISQELMLKYCYDKINQLEHFSHLAEEEKMKLAKLHRTEYCLNIESVKQVYEGSYYQIDAKDGNMEKLIEETHRILILEGRAQIPSKPIQILIHGYPSVVRTCLGKEIAKKYGLVFVSSPNLIANEIIRQTPDGTLMKSNFEKGELVNEATILKLVKTRITQKDCKLRGFVLEGFPKTETQLEYLQFMGIKPVLFILLDDLTVDVRTPAHKETLEAEKRSRAFNSFIENNYAGNLLKLNSGESFKNLIEESYFLIQNL